MPLLSPVLLVLAHPRPDSFTHAVGAQVRTVLNEAGARVLFHDLYAESFDPVLPAAQSQTAGPDAAAAAATEADPLVLRHRADLVAARSLVVVHPNWWGKPPAILAGWLDRVLVPGVAYRLDRPGGAATSLLGMQRMLIVNTSDTPPARERDEIGDPLGLIWRNAVRPFLGAPEIERMVLPGVSEAGPEQRARWLAGVARAAAWVSGAAR